MNEWALEGTYYWSRYRYINNIIVRLSVVMHHDPEPYVQRPNGVQQDPKPWQDLHGCIYWHFLLATFFTTLSILSAPSS